MELGQVEKKQQVYLDEKKKKQSRQLEIVFSYDAENLKTIKKMDSFSLLQTFERFP